MSEGLKTSVPVFQHSYELQVWKNFLVCRFIHWYYKLHFNCHCLHYCSRLSCYQKNKALCSEEQVLLTCCLAALSLSSFLFSLSSSTCSREANDATLSIFIEWKNCWSSKSFNQWFCSRWQNLNILSDSSCCCCRLVEVLIAGCFAIGIALSFKFLSQQF